MWEERPVPVWDSKPRARACCAANTIVLSCHTLSCTAATDTCAYARHALTKARVRRVCWCLTLRVVAAASCSTAVVCALRDTLRDTPRDTLRDTGRGGKLQHVRGERA